MPEPMRDEGELLPQADRGHTEGGVWRDGSEQNAGGETEANPGWTSRPKASTIEAEPAKRGDVKTVGH